MYYTDKTLRTTEKSMKHSPTTRFFTLPSCSQMPVVFYHGAIHGLGFFICSLIALMKLHKRWTFKRQFTTYFFGNDTNI